jgi:hypothetical protein
MLSDLAKSDTLLENWYSIMQEARHPSLTESVRLQGGQDRLRQLTLYVSQECSRSERFGLVKLNKTLWKADFDAYASRQVPITGRPYQRLEQGPAPKEMPHVLRDLLRDGMIHLEVTDFGDGIREKKPIPLGKPNMSYFSEEDMRFVETAIRHYWDLTGQESSDDSHGVAWRSRANGTPMFYELAYLSDRNAGPLQSERALSKAAKAGWSSL